MAKVQSWEVSDSFWASKGGQAFVYLIRNESSFFAPFSYNQRPDPLYTFEEF